MQDETSAETLTPSGGTNGASPKVQETAKRTPPLPINQRAPRGKNLPGYAVEYFNQLVAQYLTLPGTDGNARNVVANELAKDLVREQHKQAQDQGIFHWLWGRKRHYLNWADVSGMEMALLQLLPEAYLQRYAWNLRARYHEVAGQVWYDYYRQSNPPKEPAPPKEAGDAAIAITGIPAGASGLFLLTPPTQEPPKSAIGEDSPAAAGLRADLSVLLSDLQRLRSTVQAREEKHSRISLIGALLAAVSLTLALGFYGGPSLYGAWASEKAAPARVARAAMPPLADSRPAGPGASSVKSKTAVTAHPDAAPSDPAAAPLRILQMSALIILCGVLGGLISMLRRLQALPPGSTPLFDTIALDAGQLGIGLAPIYGGIFAMVLYLVFLSGILDTVIASTAGDTVFPRFSDATPKTTPDYAKLLVWAFIAGFAEQLVPDVLNRLTTRNAAILAKAAGTQGTAPPSRPA